MDNPDLRWELITRYISGECSEDERRQVEEWMEADASNKEMVTLLQKAWEGSPDKPADAWDVDSAWLRYNIRYGKDFENDQETREQPDEMNYIREIGASRRRRSNILRWGSVLAATAMICIAFLFGYQPEETESAEPTELTREIVANHGQRIHLRLSDGTKVILNSGSRITTPNTFSDSTRNIRLEGEAFFDVATDSSRPFLIQAAHSVTEVLGTKFSVKAYSVDEEVQVVVQEGRVALWGRTGDDRFPGKEITRNQMGVIPQGKSPVVNEVKDMEKYLGWTEGKLVFSGDPLSQIETKLERWYDIRLDIDTGLGHADHRLTATFSDEQSLPEVLEAIALSLDLKYKKGKSGGTYIIYE
ncbi:FecR domain-containing protein [Aliifodinibius sp. S!AR15-10]|uniref:FecR domain-containing protein n=1 Tax=Aliifodinibius sp. S!AR15-10 TaxID=2950437 RepID=UPI00285DE84A|nr:FecR domain-containing protein [Aliifodinibius sp. S!AR15-10]MDR8393598.1 FecR domain-containing protein [Aliifodinibius sp. S!AR15-10]